MCMLAFGAFNNYVLRNRHFSKSFTAKIFRSLVSSYLLHSEAYVAAIVEPNSQWIPIRYKHPLPHVELAPRDYQRVLKAARASDGVETNTVS